MKQYLISLLSLLFVNFAHAAQYALIAGGSGEDLKKENFFAADFKTYKEKLEKRNWQVTVLFDKDVGKVPGSQIATNKNIDDGINRIIEKLRPGDQVLLNFHAHGRDSELRWGAYHSIVSEDPGGYSLSKLDEYAAAIKAKGATIAVVDLSCYSGHTQNLNHSTRDSNQYVERGCVVSLASERYVSICSGDSASNSFTSAFINLPNPSVKINLEAHFLKSREKDFSSSNLPQISSITLPAKNFWDFFLSVGDPSSVSREKGFAAANTEASACVFCQRVGEYTEEIAKIKKLAEQVGGADLSKELMDAFQNYMSTYGEISSLVETIQKKMGQIPSWGFTESALTQFNKVSLGRMDFFVSFTEPKVQLKNIKWIDDDTRERLMKMRPYHRKLKSAYQKMIGALGDDWKSYEKMKENLDQQGKSVMAAERKLFALYAKSRSTQRKSQSCQDFEL